ncbi:trypsin-like serine protease [Streptomyces sp. NPDC002039]|uniref:trypsin-like serine peptidase n=1 Tax=Streptomyces sp. NPDC002039 TaxID=3154660 RepID=UPI00331BC4EE
MLFAVDQNMRAHFCTASTVRSTGGGLLLTAAHCVNSKAVFVPQYDATKPLAEQPHGIWPVEEWFTDKQFVHGQSSASDLDYAFGRVKTGEARTLQDTTGGNTPVRTPGFDNNTTVIGYPSVGHNPQDLPVRCPTRSRSLPGYNQMQIDCAGMWGGVSGGPWFSSLDEAGGTGQIIGVVGGFNGGGPAVPASDPLYNRITYSPLFTDRFFKLYDDAQSSLHANLGPYPPQTLPFTLGGADRWRNATMTAGGNFVGSAHSDLVTVWADGSVSLFQGSDSNDPKHPFSAEYKLAPAGSVWKYARAVSAGGFTGTGTDGLLVRWSDGELTEYAHVDAKGFHDEKTHRPANTVLWQSAKSITTGQYTANPLRDDLLVVWADGKVSLYPDIHVNGVAREAMLAKANTTWTHAEQISAGEFTGKKTHDLMVRWSDGETTIYPGVDSAGFHSEIKIREPKSPWLQAKVITVGDFVAPGPARDVLVRWTNGGLSLFPAVDNTGTHAEVKLVE